MSLFLRVPVDIGHTVYEDTFGFQVSGAFPFEASYGPVNVEGEVNYFAELTPHFSNDLVFDGISGNAWLDPNLTITIPLGQARIPLLSAPDIVAIAVGANAGMSFGTASGHDHMFSITPAITIDGTGGVGTSNNRGVDIRGSGTNGRVSSVDGDMHITGRAGGGTASPSSCSTATPLK